MTADQKPDIGGLELIPDKERLETIQKIIQLQEYLDAALQGETRPLCLTLVYSYGKHIGSSLSRLTPPGLVIQPDHLGIFTYQLSLTTEGRLVQGLPENTVVKDCKPMVTPLLVPSIETDPLVLGQDLTERPFLVLVTVGQWNIYKLITQKFSVLPLVHEFYKKLEN